MTEIEQLYSAGKPDHAQILARLKSMRDLCPTLGELYKYSACSAAALGQTGDANYFRTRASLANVKDLTCPGETNATAPPPLPRTVHEKYALIVGIGSFKDPKIPRLQFAAKDARDLAALLADPAYGRFKASNVTLLTEQEATRERILVALQGLFDVVREDDLVVLYISSHGSPHKSESGLTGVGHIVTHDAELKNLYVNALGYEEFSHFVSLLKARRKVVFLDTCYSGEASKPGSKALFIEAAGISSKTAKLFLSGEGAFVVTSSSASERSWESESIHNSYFTHFLLEALRRPGDPPTLGEVFAELARKVPEAVAREQGAPQHPQIFPEAGARDLRLGVIAQSASSNQPSEGVPPL